METVYYLGEICQAVEEVTGVHIPEPTICRVLRKNGLKRKKICLVAAQRSLYLWTRLVVMLITIYGGLATLYMGCVQLESLYSE